MFRFAVLLSLLLGSAVHAQSVSVVDGKQDVIGTYLGPGGVFEAIVPGTPPNSIAEPGLLVVSSTGFVFGLLHDRGRIAAELIPPGGPVPSNRGDGEFLYYLTPDCSGPANVDPNPPGPVFRGGFLFANALGIFYAPKSAVTSSQVIRSVRLGSNGSCGATAESETRNVIEVLPNDPAVTGVSSADFVSPITISRVDPPNPMFGDGFESPV